MVKDLIWHHSIFPSLENEKIIKTLPKALIELVEEKAYSPAVVLENKTYTFQDLANRVAGLSEEINELGNYSGPIALVQKIGIDAIAAWFACSLSGKPFLLLEPDNPKERLIELIRSSGCTLALVDQSTSSILEDLPEMALLISKGRLSKFNQAKGLSPEDPAMVFPTSGSTGNPKLITYATTTIQVKVQASIQLMEIEEGARVMIAGSHSNYGFLHHALVFLLSGNSVFLADIKVAGFNSILTGITDFGVRHLRFTPSLFRKLATLPKAKEALRLLNAIRFSGEPLLASDLKLAQSKLNEDCLIQNVYGSTESSLFIWKNTDDNHSEATPTVPVGRIYPHSMYAIRPLDNEDIKEGKGELLIRSKFHALGDLNRGGIDSERFSLVEGSSDERVYASGDIVQQLENGTLLHLGRLGRMVKIRGNRVYLTEVEQQLRSIPGVTEAVVVDTVEQENTILYGFITTDLERENSGEVRSKLSSKVPDYMVPKRILTLAEMPLLVGGKVDIQSLIVLVSSPDQNNQLDTEISDADRLIQIWDKHLWEGAHNHHSDFFSLGGNSLGYMILLDDLEKSFGKSFSSNQLRTQCTLKNIADKLGIESPTEISVIKYKSLQAKFSCPSLVNSKGVALAMPNVGGASQAYPFYQAGFFQDYDMWVVELPSTSGSLLQENKWWDAACEIVQGIKEGVIPSPKIIFGYSFAGGLAWLVSRLLADTDCKPEFVVMVDAPALHRRRRLGHRVIKKALKALTNVVSPPVLHIRRASLNNEDVYRESIQEWNKSDNVQHVIDLPTVDHFEMIKLELLAYAKDAVTSFLSNKEVNFHWSSIQSPPDFPGCHLFYAFKGRNDSLVKLKEKLARGTEYIEERLHLELAILMHCTNDKTKSEELIRTILSKRPDFLRVLIANRRLRHKADILFSEDFPKIYPISIVSIDEKLTAMKNSTIQPKPRTYRQLILFIDVTIALAISIYCKYRNKLFYSKMKKTKRRFITKNQRTNKQ